MGALTMPKDSCRRETGTKTDPKRTLEMDEKMTVILVTKMGTQNRQAAPHKDLSCICQVFQIMLSKVTLRSYVPKLAASL